MYVCMYMCLYIISEEMLQNSRRSLLLEINDFLQYVKEKFSGVLLPVDNITKQGLIGKGFKETLYNFYYITSTAWMGIL